MCGQVRFVRKNYTKSSLQRCKTAFLFEKFQVQKPFRVPKV